MLGCQGGSKGVQFCKGSSTPTFTQCLYGAHIGYWGTATLEQIGTQYAYHGIGDAHRVNGLMRSLYLQLEVKSIVVGLKAVHL